MKQELIAESWENACHQIGTVEDVTVLSDMICIVPATCTKKGLIFINGRPIGGFTSLYGHRIRFNISDPLTSEEIDNLNAVILNGNWVMDFVEGSEPRFRNVDTGMIIPYVDGIEFDYAPQEILIHIGKTDDGIQIVATEQFAKDWKREMGQDLVPPIPDDEIGALFGQDT